MTAVALQTSTKVTTVASRVRDRGLQMPDRVAMREKDFGIWQEVSWADYWNHAELVGHALLALGIEPGDRVAVHSENRREWLYSDIGAISVRAITVGLYPTNPAAEVAYLLSNSGARVLIAEDQEQVDKALEVLDQLPELEKIVYLEPRGIRYRYTDPKLISWDDFLALGGRHRDAEPEAVNRRMAEATEDDILTLVYTSGTTGPPKGAMLAVSDVEFCIKVLVADGGFTSPPPSPADITLSYLPLCHIAERIFTTWFSACAAIQVHFAESIETVQENLREVQPTILFGVPRIWEKVLAAVRIRIDSTSWFKRVSSRFWLGVADGIAETLVRNGGRHTMSTRVRYAIGWVCYYRALRDRIGLRKVRYASSGAAPVAPEVLRFFMGIGVPMHELYGMTENTAIATANRPGRVKLGTVGEPHAGIELRIDEATGEILTRHPGTFAGYWKNPEATARTIDADGWLHTGDVGEWVDGTHLRDHRPHEGHHHHRGRQERGAVGIRELAQGLAVHQGGHRDRRRSEISHRVDRDRAGYRRSLGTDPEAALYDVPGPRREGRGPCAGPVHRGRRQRAVRPGRAGEEVHHAAKGIGSRGR